MLPLTLNILLQLAAANPNGQDYATAYQQTMETGRPLVVLIGADWCPGCRQMKQTAIPEVERQGGLRKVEYAYINSDHQSKLAGQLMQGASIPQLILFRKTESGWRRQQLTGAQSPTAIQKFLSEGESAEVAEVDHHQKMD
jgi:thioredoxin-like negative regulator of GroEL